MRLASLLLAPLALALAACGGTTASRTPATTAHPAPAVLEIVQKIDTTKGIYIEGFVWNLGVHDAGGRTAYNQQVAQRTVEISLAPGTYHVDSNVQPCDGTCDSLDGVTDACATGVTLAAGEHRRLVVNMAAETPSRFT